MIDEISLDRTGWARFSEDRTKRYRLGRVLDPKFELMSSDGHVTGYRAVPVPCDCPSPGIHRECHCRSTRFRLPFASDEWCNCLCHGFVNRVTFVLLNPSTADAFKPDQTVTKCMKFARHWGAHVLEVVNLFAYRSTWPEDLDAATTEQLGIDLTADAEILAACRGAYRVIAGWGNHGWRHGRDAIVRDRLRQANLQLLHLGLTKDLRPLHPMARGKFLIPIDREPLPWSAP